MATRHTCLARRAATVGLAAALLFLAGFSLWSAATSEHAAAQLRNSKQLTTAYDQARFAMDDERLLEHEYMIGHGGNYTPARSQSLHRRFDTIASQVGRRLADVVRHGNAEDRRLARELTSLQRTYQKWTDAVFTSAHLAHSAMAKMNGAGADQDFVRLRDEMTRVTDANDATTLHQLTDLHRTEERIRAATWTVIGLALLLFGMCSLIVRASRRRGAALTQAELTRLERHALIDNLTQLRNNRAFEDDLTRHLARTARSGEPLTLVFLDLDGLKQTNDSQGHQAGDEKLRALAQAMRHSARIADGAYRVAGDEFALILPEARAVRGLEMAHRVQKALRHGNGGLATVTAGVAEADPGIDRDELIRTADVALIEAKRTRRGVLIYSPELDGGLDEQRGDHEHDGPAGIASALVRVVDAKESFTRSHSETVSEICVLIATELGVDYGRSGELRLAGLLHDIGKIGISDAILTKPGPLTEQELDLMRTHSMLGCRIVEATGLSRQASWILHSHERFDGRGYPDGLAAENIPLESRIILVADAFEALTADHPYRERCPDRQALAEIRRHAGTQVDPHCVAALEHVVLGGAVERDLVPSVA